MFAYCGNNPVNRDDSSGEFLGITAALFIPAGVVAVVTAVLIVVVLIVAAVITVAVETYRNSHITYSSDSSSGSTVRNTPKNTAKNTPSSKSTSKSKQGSPVKSKSKVFPQNPKDMDKILGKKGKPIKDGPTTQGRNKIK